MYVLVDEMKRAWPCVYNTLGTMVAWWQKHYERDECFLGTPDDPANAPAVMRPPPIKRCFHVYGINLDTPVRLY